MNYQKIIKDNGLKQTWIAKQLGITDSLLSMFFKGKSGMAEETVFKLNKIIKPYIEKEMKNEFN
jgi:predicted transcriptional regulator